MVYHSVTERESKDHQRCLSARAGTQNQNVQLLGIQRLADFLTSNVHRWYNPYQDSKIVYRRYASLFFIAGCASTDNELITLEIVHRYVEQMDKYYGNVCELDIIFNFQKAYFILDELLLAGEMQESSKKNVLRVISAQDGIEDTEVSWHGLLALWGSYTVFQFEEEIYLRATPSTIPHALTHIPLHQVDEEVTKIM